MHTKSIQIENYKSIKDLQLKTKRVNVFIGEPNSGKTNIIEALFFLSFNASSESIFNEIVRFDSFDELFTDSDLSCPIKIFSDNLKCTIEFYKNESGAITNQFLCRYFKGMETETVFEYHYDFGGKISHDKGENFSNNICYYAFKRHKSFNQSFRLFLNPPFGDNIPSLLLSNNELRKLVLDIFLDKGFRLEIKPKENKLFIAKDVGGLLYSYPYFTISETLQRIVFMMLAIETNKNRILLFDEPESNTFPFYTKYIAERIALDQTNQYFLTTHNPYLLKSIIEKTSAQDLNVVVTKMVDFKTKCFSLNNRQISKAQEANFDILFNLDNLIK